MKFIKNKAFVTGGSGFIGSHIVQELSKDKNNQIFHAGTYKKNKKIYSNGGRVLNITSSSIDLAKAREKSLENISKVNWADGFFRKDIGWKVIKSK